MRRLRRECPGAMASCPHTYQLKASHGCSGNKSPFTEGGFICFLVGVKSFWPPSAKGVGGFSGMNQLKLMPMDYGTYGLMPSLRLEV